MANLSSTEGSATRVTDLLLYLVIIATAAVLARGLIKRGGYLEYPFLAAAVYAGWFLPQAIALRMDPRLDLTMVLAMSLLCLGAIVLGWRLGTEKQLSRPPIGLLVDRMIWPVVGLTAFATGMQILIELQPAEARAATRWTGILTILAFFGQVGVVSLSFSFLLFLRSKSTATIALLGWNLALYAPSVLLTFRRSETGEFLLAAVLALFFVRRVTVPRTLILAGLVLGFVFIHAVGHLRALSGGYQLDDSGQITTKIPTLEELAGIDFFAATPLGENNIAYEVRNAINYMSAIEKSGDLTLGAEFWNRLVFAYVPGQLVGYEFKSSLMIGHSLSDLALNEAGYETHIGSTHTGFADSYRDFWFFGAIIFLFTSYYMARTYSLGRRGDVFSQALYMSCIMIALHAITHSSYYYFLNLPILLAAALATVSIGRHRPSSNYRRTLPLEERFVSQRIQKVGQ